MTKHIKLDETQTANWHDPDGADREQARRLIRADARLQASNAGADRVEISDDEGVVVDAWETDWLREAASAAEVR